MAARAHARVVAAVACLVLTGVAFAGILLGASPMLNRAQSLTLDCGIRLQDPRLEPGTHADCRNAPKWLAIPTLVPWTRDDARRTRWELDESHAMWRLRKCAVAPHSAQDVSAAANALVALDSDARVGASRIVPSRHARLMAGVGACRELIAADAQLHEADARGIALWCALRDADFEAAKRIARVDAPIQSVQGHYDLQRAALLCLEGDPDVAAPIFDQVQADLSRSKGIRILARAARMACGPPVPQVVDTNDARHLQAVAMSDPDHRAHLTKSLAEANDYDWHFASTHTALIAAVIAERELPHGRLRSLLAGANWVAAVSGPWQLAPDGMGGYMPASIAVYPEDLVRAAERLDAIAEAAAPRSVAAKPEASEERERLVELPLVPEAHNREQNFLRADPSSLFPAAADTFRLLAAAEHARLGHQQPARRLVLAVLERRPTADVMAYALSVLMRARDWTTAKEVAERVRPEESFLPVAVASAWTDMHDRKWDRVIKKLDPTLFDSPEPELDRRRRIWREARANGIWMLLAAHVGLGKRPPEHVRKAFRQWIDVGDKGLCGRNLLSGGPAALFVLGADPAGVEDVESWLDTRAPDCRHVDRDADLGNRRPAPPIALAVYARMRQEAARYRGDAKAAAIWKKRGDTLDARRNEPVRAFLASLAGI